jgi:hypothetical protein
VPYRFCKTLATEPCLSGDHEFRIEFDQLEENILRETVSHPKVAMPVEIACSELGCGNKALVNLTYVPEYVYFDKCPFEVEFVEQRH